MVEVLNILVLLQHKHRQNVYTVSRVYNTTILYYRLVFYVFIDVFQAHKFNISMNI